MYSKMPRKKLDYFADSSHLYQFLDFSLLLSLLLYFPFGYPKGNGPKARGSPGEKEMKTIVKNEDEW